MENRLMTGLDEDLQSTSQRLEQMTMEGVSTPKNQNNAGAALGADEKWPHPNFGPTAIQPKFIPQSPSLPSSSFRIFLLLLKVGKEGIKYVLTF